MHLIFFFKISNSKDRYFYIFSFETTSFSSLLFSPETAARYRFIRKCLPPPLTRDETEIQFIIREYHPCANKVEESESGGEARCLRAATLEKAVGRWNLGNRAMRIIINLSSISFLATRTNFSNFQFKESYDY